MDDASPNSNIQSDLTPSPNPKPQPKPTPPPPSQGRSRDRDRLRGPVTEPPPISAPESASEAWVGPVSSGLARLAEGSDPAATSLELSTDAGLSVPAGEPLGPDPLDADTTPGRSA